MRYSFRGLTRQKSFATTAIATLALGIGATTAVFSVVNGVVLKALPFAEPDRLVQMYGMPAIRGEAVGHLDEVRSQSTSFETLIGYGVSARYVRKGAKSIQLRLLPASRAANADPLSLLRSE